MTYARSEIVERDSVSVYHCVSRCVRRAFLCGADPVSGKSFEHRREWIRGRLSSLIDIFAIEIIAYAVMNNHLHTLIRSRPDVVRSWSDEEVARRWRTLFPFRRIKGKPAPPSKEEIKAIVGQKQLVELYRERLSCLSWFNRCLNENIARRANAEDECKGRFWEGRFKCQRVYDVAGIIACSAYIDLNPVRSGIAKTLEESDHTSIQDRVIEHAKKRASTKLSKGVLLRHKEWPKVRLVSIGEVTERSLTVLEYLRLVDETGRLIVEGKGAISAEIGPILERLKLNPGEWVQRTEFFRDSFRRAVGPEERLRALAKRLKKACMHGFRAARKLFKAPPITSSA